MTRFTAHNHSTADVDASQEQIWTALTDTELLPRLTPFLKRIDVVDGKWVWTLTSIPVLTKQISPSFTEVMTFEPMTHITFTHDPSKTDEQAGAEGSYTLTPNGARTHLAIDLEVSVDLPLPKLAKPGVLAGMNTVMAAMGSRFATNLLKHLDATR
ncbi:SRPBCC family protein [Allobranchiibius huperziae]|uniref:Carbon monoxide dehydrogenase subunit G n=1 Tax=Allobranchiibius huperziae TaxID=1874116 RepID=A0A853DGN1_9MICO|nr:SRPBCC family protein [Allobranchiibius huperziae]NYJ75948.1 carbon monoxide dehydrogenase subunit G [Allobranchiibius huperziae]